MSELAADSAKFNRVCTKMAAAYVAGGSVDGNKLMAEFDAAAEELAPEVLRVRPVEIAHDGVRLFRKA